MKTAIHGTLVALGTPAPEHFEQRTQPRALVHCTEEQIRSVEKAAMFQPVVIVAKAELDALLVEPQSYCDAAERPDSELRQNP